MNAALRPPESAGLGPGLALALLAHGLLVVALSAGVSWRSTSTPAFEAELWSAVPQIAAPRAESPPEDDPPPPQPVQPNRAEQERVAEEAQQREADIAIARERMRKEREKKQRELELAAEAKLEKELKAKLEKAKAEKERAEKLKATAAREQKEAKQAKDNEARQEAQRQENLRRIQGLAGATGAPGSSGTALQSSAPSAGYGGRIKARIRPLIIYSVEGNANPEAEVRISLAPDGRIVGVKMIRASADPDWDRAVQRAIDKAESVPRDLDGRVPGYIDLVLRPRE